MVLMLDLEHWSKSTLIRGVASHAEDDDATMPQQKSSLLDSYTEDIGSPNSGASAKVFTEAFNEVFKEEEITLRDVLMLDETVETVVDSKKIKDTSTPSLHKTADEDLLLGIEQFLATYSILGCLICFSHDCEHGEYDTENQKRCFSVDSFGRLGTLRKKKWAEQSK
jgi:hypothetical protein